MASVAALLSEARDVGLSVCVEAAELVVRGPVAARPTAEKLLARKPEVIEALTAAVINPEAEQGTERPGDVWPDGWPPDALAPDDVGHCERCGSYERWLPLTGPPWQCRRCEPPLWLPDG